MHRTTHIDTSTWRAPRASALCAAILAALTLAAAGSVAGPVASADAHYLSTKDVFHFPAWSPNGSRCITRTVRLEAGLWKHGAYLVSSSHRTFPDLNEGGAPIAVPKTARYAWKSCRYWNRQFRQYRVRSTLRRGSWWRTQRNELNSNYISGDGTYEWGGRLVWYGPFGMTGPSR